MKYSYVFFALFVGVIACTGEKKDAQTEKSVEIVLPEQKNEVTVQPLKFSDFSHELVSNGKLSAQKYVDLTFQSSEPIAAIYVKNGDRVSKGQKLAELDRFRLSNSLAQTADALERSRLELQDVLIGQGYSLEDSANVPPAVMKLARVKSGYGQSLVQYELARHNYDQAVLTAPFDGIVANLFSKQYNTASPSQPFCTLIDNNSLQAEFTVLESELPLIKEGDRVDVTPFAVAGTLIEGRVAEINPLVDENGMVKVKARVNASNKLFEGMNVRISIHRTVPRQLVVPKTAVVLRSGKQVVFTLIKDSIAYWNYIHTGLENTSEYTIADGLKEGDIVIVDNNINLANESPVKVIEK